MDSAVLNKKFISIAFLGLFVRSFVGSVSLYFSIYLYVYYRSGWFTPVRRWLPLAVAAAGGGGGDFDIERANR